MLCGYARAWGPAAGKNPGAEYEWLYGSVGGLGGAVVSAQRRGGL